MDVYKYVICDNKNIKGDGEVWEQFLYAIEVLLVSV